MTFTAEIWAESAGLIEKILSLPFNRGLTAGTLSEERFKFYVIQDSLYLNTYSRVLSLVSAKSPDPEAMLRYAKSAQEAIEVERILHAGFLKQFGISDEDLAQAEKSPTCAAYTNFLLATAATGSYEELVAAVLPCFWIYWHVGGVISKTASKDNPYRAWIDTYTNDVFANAVKAVIAITDDVAAKASADGRIAMKKAFVLSSVYEWMFWDSAYKQEAWPVGL